MINSFGEKQQQLMTIFMQPRH